MTARKKYQSDKPCSILGCPRPMSYRGMCNTHAERNRRHGSPYTVNGVRVIEPAQPPANEWEAVFRNRYTVTTEDCWEMTKRPKNTGYHEIGWQGQVYGAHRLSYELAVGPIPEGMTIDHLCFNPPCMNPAHLRLLTHSENSANKKPKEWLGCNKGHPPTPENTYTVARSSGRVERGCKVCRRNRQLMRGAA